MKNYYNPDKARSYYQTNRERILLRTKNRRLDDEARKRDRLAVARSRASKKGIPFDLKVEDLDWVATCPLLGIQLNYFSGTNGPDSPSIDRKDPRQGYTKENCWVISNKANSIKNNGTLEEIELIAMNLKKYL